MKSIILKTTCHGNHVNTILGRPLDKPGKLEGERVAERDKFCFKIRINAFFAILTESTTLLIFWHVLPTKLTGSI